MHRRTMQNALLLVLIVGVAASTIPTASAGEAQADTLVYTVKSGDSLQRIASRQRTAAGYYASFDLLDDIREANGLTSNLIRPGQTLLVPVKTPRPHPTVTQTVADGATHRGIYLTGPVCSSERVFDRIDRFVDVGGNAVVFDVKDADGGVSVRSAQPLASWGKGRNAPVISNMSELLTRLQDRRLYVVARIACFLDGDLGRSRPDLALHDDLGEPWTERDQIWMNPADETVQDYLIGLAVEMAQAGVDEVQFDYVRFPTNGWKGDSPNDREESAAWRRSVITGFLKKADEALAPYPVTISADLYGIMAWGRLADRAVTGQDIGEIARYVDVICPMVYPSHYKAGYMGYEQPADHPGFFVGEPCRRFLVQAAGQARVRPWLQAFPYKVHNYDDRYVALQIDAAVEAGAEGWMLWNPSSRYDKALAAVTPPAPVEPLLALVDRRAAMAPTIITPPLP